MGYRPKRKIYNLDFTGTEDHGLIVAMRGPTVGEELEIGEASDQDGRRVFELMAGLLVEWNVEDDQGRPVPATVEGVRQQDAAFVMRILNTLRAAASQVPAPLPSDSTSGATSLVESIPMELLSPSPENSAVPA